MGLSAYSEEIVWIAFMAGFFVLALAFLIMLQILAIHARAAMKRARERRFLSQWRPILMNAMIEVPGELPRISKKDNVSFLVLWSKLKESVKGDSSIKLNEVMRKTGMDGAARGMLRKGDFRGRMLAISTLGHLKEKSVWEDLRFFLSSDNPALSLSAARAMVHISPEEAVGELIPHIEGHKEWASFKVANILREAGADVFSGPLAEAVAKNPTPSLIRFLSLARYDIAMSAVRRILESSGDEEVISACLHVLKDPRDLELVRGFVGHPSWFIRVQAAIALGRIGVEEDKDRLIGLLGDKEWWVRYRAAQALAGMPFISTEQLEQIRNEHKDRYAKDILEQVMAESAAA